MPRPGNKLTVEWDDQGREPQCPPDPLFPHGRDIDISEGARATCSITLDHPAPRCGLWVVRCEECGISVGVTAAGRPDDPRSLKVACRQQETARYPEAKLGPTGDFPDGKLGQEDEGGLTMAIGLSPQDGKTVIVNFGKKVDWIGLPPAQAIEFAFSILRHAGIEITREPKQ